MAGRVLPALLAAAVVGCGGAGTPQAGGGREARALAQDFQLDDVNGHRFQLSEYRGKAVVLLDFWATWCDPCKVEIPRLVEIHERYRDRGFVIAAISVDGPESIAQVRQDARQLRIPFPVLLDQESRVVAMFNPRRSCPYAVLIDRVGRVVQQHEGYSPGDEINLTREVELALGP